jgi:UDP-glucose 4-epimerase
MRVAVTGGCGFIGSHVVDRLLRDRADVLVIDNFSKGRDHWARSSRRPEIIRVDVTNRSAKIETIAEWRPDAVIHLAAHHYIPFCEQNAAEAYRLNVGGTLNVLEAAVAADAKRFFFASTADVYGPSARPHAESDTVAPFTVYGRTKLIGETMVGELPRLGFKGDIVVGRIFNAVGPRETNPHLVPEMVLQLKRGVRQLMVGNLSPTRDFVDVASMGEVIVDVTMLARPAAEPAPTVVNIGSGRSIAVSEMVALICQASGVSPTVTVDPARVRPAEREHLCAEVTRLKQLIGRAPHEAGLAVLKQLFLEGAAA